MDWYPWFPNESVIFLLVQPWVFSNCETRQLFWLNFVIMFYNLIQQCNSGWKMTPFAAKLVSDKPCFCHDIFFATGTRVLGKNEKSVTLSVLSVLIRWSMLHFLATGNVGTSWLAHRVLIRLCQQQSVRKPHRWLRQTSLLRRNFPSNHFVSVLTGLKRESDNKRNKAPASANSCTGLASQRVSCYS